MYHLNKSKRQYSNKSCASDPIPTDMIKDCIDDLLPAISNMVNSSLVYGYFPDTWKEALVKPRLKTSNMDLIKKELSPCEQPYLSVQDD